MLNLVLVLITPGISGAPPSALLEVMVARVFIFVITLNRCLIA